MMVFVVYISALDAESRWETVTRTVSQDTSRAPTVQYPHQAHHGVCFSGGESAGALPAPCNKTALL